MSATAYDRTNNLRWFVCFLLFLATTINYMDRSAFSLIEPMLHNVAFMGWNPAADKFHQPLFDNNFGNVIQFFQIAYGIGLFFGGRIIDKLGTKTGYALAILVWGLSSMGHSLVASVAGFYLARVLLGLGESGNFPAAIKATSEWFPAEERALATGLFNSGTNVSFFVAPLLIGAATSRWGWRAAFLATGSLGMLWLILWMFFPYNKLRRGATTTQQALAPVVPNQNRVYSAVATKPGLYAFSVGKFLTDGVWWFYLFYLPQFLNRNYGLNPLTTGYWEIGTVYLISSVGSIFGGSLSGWRMRNGYSVNHSRKLALLSCAVLALPLMIVPHLGHVFPSNPWPATLIIALAAAGHQGFSANLFSTPSDMFPSTAISTVVGIGGAAGAVGGAIFTALVKSNLSLHPAVVFTVASLLYVIALAIFQILVPRLGAPQAPETPISAT